MSKLLIISISTMMFLTGSAFAGKTYCEKHKRRCQNSTRWCNQHPGKCKIPTEIYCKSHPAICDRG